ncbi:MAG: FAD-dependent oxidoreductase, partial [Candidatus Binatia bacterium]
EKHGVKFRLGEQVTGFDGDAAVRSVLLGSGDRIETDLVLVGIGVRPATGFLRGMDLRKDGGVVADGHLRIGEGLYVSGDIAYFPDARTGESVRIEHWRTALQQGRTAAHNMAGKPATFSAVPFFWTTQFDATLNYVGHAKDWAEIIIQGDVAKQDFLAFYVKDHKVLAVAGMNRDRDLAFIEELIRLNRMPPLHELRENSLNFSTGSIDSTNYAPRRVL